MQQQLATARTDNEARQELSLFNTSYKRLDSLVEEIENWSTTCDVKTMKDVATVRLALKSAQVTVSIIALIAKVHVFR